MTEAANRWSGDKERRCCSPVLPVVVRKSCWATVLNFVLVLVEVVVVVAFQAGGWCCSCCCSCCCCCCCCWCCCSAAAASCRACCCRINVLRWAFIARTSSSCNHTARHSPAVNEVRDGISCRSTCSAKPIDRWRWTGWRTPRTRTAWNVPSVERTRGTPRWGLVVVRVTVAGFKEDRRGCRAGW